MQLVRWISDLRSRLRRANCMLHHAFILALAINCSCSNHFQQASQDKESNNTFANSTTKARLDYTYEQCMLCHSTREMQRGPILNGLPEWYIVSQLYKFLGGIRGANAENRSAYLMHAAISQLSDTNIFNFLAERIENSPKFKPLRTIHGNLQNGRSIYISICTACHGEEGHGNKELKSPPINVQEDWYLLDQLRKFKAGLRGSHPEDYEGQAMQSVVFPLGDTNLRDVVTYIASEQFGNPIASPKHD